MLMRLVLLLLLLLLLLLCVGDGKLVVSLTLTREPCRLKWREETIYALVEVVHFG
jgi:hypothetical protein